MDALESCFHSELQSYVFSPEELIRSDTSTRTHIAELQAQIRSHTETIQRVDKEIDGLLTLYNKEAIDERGFQKRYKALGDRHSQLSDELPTLSQKLSKLEQSIQSQASLISESQGLAERFPKLNQAEKRLIVETLLDKVVIYDDSVEFIFYFTPNAVSPKPPFGSDSNKATQPQGFMAAIN